MNVCWLPLFLLQYLGVAVGVHTRGEGRQWGRGALWPGRTMFACMEGSPAPTVFNGIAFAFGVVFTLRILQGNQLDEFL